MTAVEPIPFAQFLKDSTRTQHESLDQRIMRANPFAARESYALFLRMQHRLHQVTSPLFQNHELHALLPELAGRDRLQEVLADMQDFAISTEQKQQDEDIAQRVPTPNTAQALGWLYTVEGSNLGAAFLLKHAKAELGLHEEFGARHLAAHSDGRGLHWRTFKEALNNLQLSDEEREAAAEGAREAFVYVRAAVEDLMKDPVVA